MKKVILFDMDGTLTPARQEMDINTEMCLRDAQQKGFEIGIITGSNMNYVRHQCSRLFDLSLIDASKVHFLPCNGTKYILDDKMIYEKNMRDYMGEKLWNRLMTLLVVLQTDLVLEHSIPLTGHFIDYRGSTLNWCPIGRNAEKQDRDKWKEMDSNYKIRKSFLKQLKTLVHTQCTHLGDLRASDVELTVKYGGDTSFDIFPLGWDKTCVLDMFDIFFDYEQIYFIGDRCEQDGNDYEIFEHPKTIGFKTNSPDETIKIVNKIIYSNV